MRRMIIADEEKNLRSMLTDVMELLLPRGQWEITQLDPTDKGADIALENEREIHCAIITFSSTPDGDDGIPLIRKVHRNYPRAPIIVLHQFEPEHLEKSSRAGAHFAIYKGDLNLKLWKNTLERIGALP